MKRTAALCLSLCLALSLAACGGDVPATASSPPDTPAPTDSPAPADTPAPSLAPGQPTPAPTWQVEVHWDALEEREAPVANYWYEGYTDDLIPSGDYGELAPYIGGEKWINQIWDPEAEPDYAPSYLYGFATADGVIVTHPVFDSIQPARGMASNAAAPLWVVSKTVVPEEGEPYLALGVAALDGSWYTGLKYSASLAGPIAACEAGVLMVESAGSAVMVGLDGRELYRWSPEDFIPDDPDMWEWFFYDGLNWALDSYGPYWLYRGSSFYGDREDIWIDARTGEFLGGRPADAPSWGYPNRQTFPGGWYDPDDPLTLHYDDGATRVLSLPEELGTPDSAAPPLLIFRDGLWAVTDLEGNILFQPDPPTSGNDFLSFVYNQTGGPSLPYYYRHRTNSYTILGLDGRPILTYAGQYYPFSMAGDTLIALDHLWYYLMDLDGNVLIRLPRPPAL